MSRLERELPGEISGAGVLLVRAVVELVLRKSLENFDERGRLVLKRLSPELMVGGHTNPPKFVALENSKNANERESTKGGFSLHANNNSCTRSTACSRRRSRRRARNCDDHLPSHTR